MKRCDLTKGLVFFLTIIITLCCGLIPSSWAEDDDGDYNKIFKGKYTYSQAGSIHIMPPPADPWVPNATQPMGAVGTFITDGKGNIYDGTETLRLGYKTITATFTGTYVLDENRMGTASITVIADNGPSPLDMEMALTITKDGKEVHLLTTEIDYAPINYLFMQPSAVVGFGTRSTD